MSDHVISKYFLFPATATLVKTAYNLQDNSMRCMIDITFSTVIIIIHSIFSVP